MIFISDSLKLQDIKIEDQPKLMTLLERIYQPAYKHLWINEDCSFYLNRFYSNENLELELSDPNAEYYFIIYNSLFPIKRIRLALLELRFLLVPVIPIFDFPLILLS